MAWEDYAPRAIASLSKDFNLTPQQAAGIIGQLGFESEGLQAINERQPVVPGSRGGFGWAQWTGPRRRQFEQWAKQSGMDINTPEANYGVLAHELSEGPESRVLDDIRKAEDAQTAGRIFTDKFLRPGIPNHEGRQSWTDKALSFIMPAAHAGEVPQEQTNISDRIAAAKEAGFTDAEIMQRLQSNEDIWGRIERAKEAGFSDDEIFGRLGLSIEASEPQEQQDPQERGLMSQVGRQLGLTARAGLEGISAFPEMLVNPISQALGGPEMRISNTLDALGFPQPETATERVAQDVAGAMAGTGGIVGAAGQAARGLTGAAQGVAQQLGSAIPQQIAGAAGAGGAGGIARESGAGPVGQTAAALAGGLLASSAANRALTPPRQKGMSDPTRDLQRRASNLYDQVERRGVTAPAQSTAQLQQNVRNIAIDEGLITPSGAIAEGYPKLNGAIRMIDEYAGQQMTAKQMQSVRRMLQNVAGSADNAERRIGTMLLRTFDDFTAPLAPELAEARNLYAAAMRGRQLETLRDVAESRSKQFSQSGLENALRSEYRTLYNRILRGQERGFNHGQVEAIRRVAEGTVPANVARQIGKLAPTGVVSAGFSGGVPFMIGNAIGGPMVGGAASLGTMGIGALGRNAATCMTSRNAALAEALARRMPLTSQTAPALTNPMGALYGAALMSER